MSTATANEPSGSENRTAPSQRFEFQEGFYAITPSRRPYSGKPYYLVQHICGTDYGWDVYMGINYSYEPNPLSRRHIYELARAISPLRWIDLTEQERLTFRTYARELLEFAVEVATHLPLFSADYSLK